MDVNQIVAELDAEIAHLQKIRTALVDIEPVARKARRGRPKGSGLLTAAAQATKAATPKKKHKLSPEGRKRIVEAMKRRWAAQRKSTK